MFVVEVSGHGRRNNHGDIVKARCPSTILPVIPDAASTRPVKLFISCTAPLLDPRPAIPGRLGQKADHIAQQPARGFLELGIATRDGASQHLVAVIHREHGAP